MKTLGYLIYYTHLYTFFSNNFREKRFACLKLLKNVQSEPKLNSIKNLDIIIDNEIIHNHNIMSYYMCLMQYLLSLLIYIYNLIGVKIVKYIKHFTLR